MQWVSTDRSERSISDYCQVRKEVAMVASFVHMYTQTNTHTHIHTEREERNSNTHINTNTHIRPCSQTDKAPHSKATHACISNACGRLGLCSREWGEAGSSGLWVDGEGGVCWVCVCVCTVHWGSLSYRGSIPPLQHHHRFCQSWLGFKAWLLNTGFM